VDAFLATQRARANSENAGAGSFMTGQLGITPVVIFMGLTTTRDMALGVIVGAMGSAVLGAFALPSVVARVASVAWSLGEWQARQPPIPAC
jgi:hypothetical protein